MNNKLCRVAGNPLAEIHDFGKQPLGNGFLDSQNYKDEYFYNMAIGFSEESYMLQLIDQPSPEKMFHEEYAFFSSTSKHMANHFKEYANSVINSKYIQGNDPFIVELGCNDGILLQHISRQGFRHLGIEPSLNVAKVANEKGVKTCSEFFSEELADKILKEHGQVDAFLAANVMCHIPSINNVAQGMGKILSPKGVIIFEDPYLGDVIEKTSYDQLYDEHVFLFSALSVQYLFGQYGLELIELIPQKTHGGSMRYILANRGSYPIDESVNIIIEKEKEMGLNKISTITQFGKRVEQSKHDLLNLLRKLKAEGKRVAGYAATSKSTTILNYCGIGTDLVEYISDTTPIKQGKFSPGTHIPVLPHSKFKQDPPDYAILFAWNHAKEIMENEKDFILSGGKWITHVPNVQIL